MPKTAYELQREANIARNRALIEQLELKSAVEALGFPSKSKSGSATAAKAKPIQPTKRVKKEKEAVDTPRRQSTRLKRAAAPVDLDESPAKRRRREKDEEEERRREEEERLAAEERAREARQPRHHDLDLSTLAMQEEWESGSLPGVQHLFTSLLATPNARLPAEGDAFVLGDAKEAAEVTALRERLSGMRVVARAKVTQERVYSMAYHPEVTKDVIFVGDKHGQLGIWDVRAAPDEQDDETPDVPASEREGGKYWRLQPHWPSTSKSSISCIKFDPLDAHSVYTSAYDCTVRQLSFESGVAREVLSTDDVLITSIDLPLASHEMWVSDTAGGLTHVDLRENKARGRWYQLSDQKIGSVSVNPRNPAYLLTASNSRSLKVWDSRKLAKIKPVAVGEDIDNEKVETFVKSPFGRGTLRAEFPHGKSVSSAYWDPRGRTIVSTSYDDTLRLWDVNPSSLAKDGPFPNFKPFSQLGHNCQTGRWLTVLKAQWSQNPDVYPHFTIGSMKHSLDILSCRGDLLASLSDKTVITAVQAVTCSHPSIVERAASGNGSGRCVLWAPEDLKI
ncbi:WD40 repeat-like protein [Auriscalpium vulgare]|uniref:WD40 repeat-like protein n=1 Tax=Auriscalpium vulgare TaxID=40419 RepID=A0ACB8SE08_9AGAM|nr:WD40 repeat-like protein [Auriscalpium vulgare]